MDTQVRMITLLCWVVVAAVVSPAQAMSEEERLQLR